MGSLSLKLTCIILWLGLGLSAYAEIPNYLLSRMRQAAQVNASKSQIAAASWTDPYYSSLALRLLFDDTSWKLTNSASIQSAYTVIGSPTWDIIGTNVNGRVDHAYSFSGADTQFLTNSSSSEVNQIVTSLTVSVWVKVRAFHLFDVLLFSAGTANNALDIALNNFNTGPLIQIGTSPTILAYFGNTSLNVTNAWTHLVYQWAAPSDLKIWRNATNLTLNATGASNQWLQTTPFRVNTYSGYNGVDGWMDDLRVYTNRVFNQADVGNLYTNTFKPSGDIEAGGVYWP